MEGARGMSGGDVEYSIEAERTKLKRLYICLEIRLMYE